MNAIHLALYLYSQNVTRMQTQKFSLRSEEFPERKAKKKGIDVRFIETFLTDIIKIIGEPESKSLPLDKVRKHPDAMGLGVSPLLFVSNAL